MNVNTLKQILLNTTSPPLAVQASNQLLEIEKTAGFMATVFQISISDADIAVRQAAAIYLKNFVKRNWYYPKQGNEEGPSVQIDDKEKQIIQGGIVDALIRAHPLVRRLLSVVLTSIAEAEYPQKWMTLPSEILKHFTSNDASRIHGALVALYSLMKKYKYFGSNINDLDEIVNMTFPVLSKLLNYLLTQNSQNFAEMRHITAKIFWAAIQHHVPALFKSNPQVFGEWMALLEKTLMLTVPDNTTEESSHWKTKKWIVHSVYRISFSFNTNNEKGTEIIHKYFVSSVAPKFLQCCLQILEKYNKGTNIPSRIISVSLYILASCIVNKNIYDQYLSSKVQYLISDILFPIFSPNNNDKASWDEDPQEYLTKSYDKIEDFYNDKISALHCVEDLFQYRKNDTFPVYVKFVSSILNSYNQDPKGFAAMKDAVLYTFGNCKKYIKASNVTKNSIQPLIATYVIPDLQSQFPFLRARACWIIERYAKLDWNQNNLTRSVNGVLQCLEDKEIIVRAKAATSLSELLNYKNITDQILPILPRVIQSFLNIMNQIDHQTIVGSLQTIISSFGDKIEPFAVSLCQRMADAFMRLYADEDDEDGEGGAIALVSLRTINILLGVLTEKHSCYESLEPSLLPIIAKILEDHTSEYVEEGLEILSYLTFYPQKVSQNTWKIYPLIFKNFHDGGSMYIHNMLAPIDNYITRDTKTFLSDPKYINSVFSVINPLFSDPNADEYLCQGAAKLISVLFQNCKGQIDSAFNQLIELTAMKLSKCKTDSLRILLLNDIADALIYNPTLLLKYLESKNSTGNLFAAWFKHLPNYKRLYDKKITVIGLSALLSLDLSKLPSSIQNNIHQVVQGCIQLLMSIHIQKKEQELEEERISKERDSILKKLNEQEDDEEGDFEDDFDENHDDIKNSKEYKELLGQLSNSTYDPYLDGDDDDDDEIEEDEILETPYDSINENICFGQTMLEISNKFPEGFKQIVSRLSKEHQNALQQLMKNAVSPANSPKK